MGLDYGPSRLREGNRPVLVTPTGNRAQGQEGGFLHGRVYQNPVTIDRRSDRRRLRPRRREVAPGPTRSGSRFRVLPGLGPGSDPRARGRNSPTPTVPTPLLRPVERATGRCAMTATKTLPHTPVPKLTSLRSLLAEPDMLTNWLVHDRMPMGGLTLLVAKPKVGKSTAARDLALAVARGEDWLGHRCSPGVVWYLAFEGRREDIKHHFQQMGATGDEPIYVFIDQPPRDMLNRLATLAANQHPNLIIVDTLQRLIQAKDMADYGEMTTRLTPLLTLAAQSNATVLLLHHAGKGKYEDIDAALGSTAIAGSADNVFLLKRGKHYRTISSIQRVGPDLEETVIELHEHSGRVRLGGSRFEAEVAVATVEILKALQNSGSQQFLSKTDLLEPIEMRRQVKFRALKLLIQQGSIVQLGSGSRSDPHR